MLLGPKPPSSAKCSQAMSHLSSLQALLSNWHYQDILYMHIWYWIFAFCWPLDEITPLTNRKLPSIIKLSALLFFFYHDFTCCCWQKAKGFISCFVCISCLIQWWFKVKGNASANIETSHLNNVHLGRECLEKSPDLRAIQTKAVIIQCTTIHSDGNFKEFSTSNLFTSFPTSII